jgi:hypothetical protein
MLQGIALGCQTKFTEPLFFTFVVSAAATIPSTRVLGIVAAALTTGGSGDGGGDGCNGALGNLPSVNDATITLIMFSTRSAMSTPLQWPRRDER